MCAAFGRRLSLLHIFIVTTHRIDDEQSNVDVSTEIERLIRSKMTEVALPVEGIEEAE